MPKNISNVYFQQAQCAANTMGGRHAMGTLPPPALP
jgi:hypothetical protein